MLIRRNTLEFKKIEKTLQENEKNKGRKKKVRIFAVKSGKKLKDRVAVDESGANADIVYNLNYEALLSYLSDDEYVLHRNEQDASLYYFNRRNDDITFYTPFQLKGRLSKAD
ncbi:MAG: hypothetical protein H0W62_11540 [Chitinophagales bacterium]|nr:hypothetical protein [Chitinophagales bacterium]